MAARRQVAGLAAVIAEGKHRASLEALRDHLAQELENAPAGIAIGPIANQLRAVLADLDALPDAKGASKVDELRDKRVARRAAAASVDVPAGGVVVGPGRV